MKLDSVISRVLTKVATKNNIETTRAYDIVDAYYKAVAHVGLTSDRATLVALEHLGKLIYNERSERAARINQDNYQLLKRNETNSIKSSN